MFLQQVLSIVDHAKRIACLTLYIIISGCGQDSSQTPAASQSSSNVRPSRLLTIENEEAQQAKSSRDVQSLVIPSRQSLDARVRWVTSGKWTGDDHEQSLSLEFKDRADSPDGDCHLVLKGPGTGLSGMKFDVDFLEDTREIQFYIHGATWNGGPPIPVDAKAFILSPGRLHLEGTFEIRDFTLSIDAVLKNEELAGTELEQAEITAQAFPVVALRQFSPFPIGHDDVPSEQKTPFPDCVSEQVPQ